MNGIGIVVKSDYFAGRSKECGGHQAKQKITQLSPSISVN